MAKKIEKSIVADNKSQITNAKIADGNNVETNVTWHKQSLIAGFVVGVVSSILASYLWENFFKQ